MLDKQPLSSQDFQEAPFDDLMASLFILLTQHSLNQCTSLLDPIVTRLDSLCKHSEAEYYPAQLRVLLKMRKLWKAKWFQIQNQQQFQH